MNDEKAPKTLNLIALAFVGLLVAASASAGDAMERDAMDGMDDQPGDSMEGDGMEGDGMDAMEGEEDSPGAGLILVLAAVGALAIARRR